MDTRRLLVVIALVLAVLSLVPLGAAFPVLTVAVLLLALAMLV